MKSHLEAKQASLEQELIQQFDRSVNLCFLKRPNAILLAVSGGIDSMALSYIAQAWCEERDVKLYAVTVDHCLRAGSREEAEAVHALMVASGIEHELLTWPEGKEVVGNIEAKAREGRYELLSDYAKDKNISIIATGHHQDDQVETFFMRLSRGSGIDGLVAMSKCIELSDNLQLFRPFLDVAKVKLQLYLEENQKKWFEDETNENTQFLRNNLRSILNQIEDKDLIDKRVIQTTKHFARAKDFLKQHTDEIYARIVTKEGDKLVISQTEFQDLHEEIALRLLVKIFKEIGGKAYKPRFEKLSELYQKLITNQINKRTTFAHTIIEIKGYNYAIYSESK